MVSCRRRGRRRRFAMVPLASWRRLPTLTQPPKRSHTHTATCPPPSGPRSARRTKLVATIGPACDSSEMLEALAVGGMNVARLNLAHGGHEYHQAVVARIRQLNKDKGYSVAIMVGVQGRAGLQGGC